MIRAATAVLAAAALAGPLRAQAWLDTARVRAAFEAEVAATHAPGASLAIVAGDRIVYELAVGVASADTRLPMTTQTLVRIGSVTKMLTGLTAALLAQEGRVDLRAPIGRSARGLHAAIASLTLADLLGHRAGLVNEGAGDGAHDDAALGARVRRWGTAQRFAPPGDVYSYSSPGYWLAGHVLEQAADTPYADLVRLRVLEPLGMMRSTFRPTMAMTWPLAVDHRVEGDSARVLHPMPDDASTWPSGSLFSSARELGRLAVALLNEGRVAGVAALPAPAVARMHERSAPIAGTDCSYAFGLSGCRRGTLDLLSHYGFRGGSGAVFTLVPSRRVGIVILSNRNGGIFRRTEAAILRMLDPTPSAEAAAEPAPQRHPGAASVTRVAGMYVSGADTLRVESRGDSLVYRYGGNTQAAGLRGDSTIVVFGADGEIEQEFMLVRGTRTGTIYLHDGLNAFRRVSKAVRR